MVAAILIILAFIGGIAVGYTYKGDIKITKTIINKEVIEYEQTVEEEDSKDTKKKQEADPFKAVDDIMEGRTGIKR